MSRLLHQCPASCPPATQVLILEQGECGHLPDPGLVHHCLRHWLTMGLDVVLPIPQLLQVVDQAIEQLFAKQGAPLPPRDANGAFIASNDAAGSSHGDSSGSASGNGSKPTDCAVQPGSAAGQALLWLVPPLSLLLVAAVVLRRPSRPHRHAV